MTLLGPLRSEGNVNNNNRRYRRWCWLPVRLSLSRGLRWGTHGWEVTSHVSGPWAHETGVYTGSCQRPHVFGWTLSLGRLRVMFGPRTGWDALSRKELLMLLRKTDGRLASANDIINAQAAELAMLRVQQEATND